MNKTHKAVVSVKGTQVTVLDHHKQDYISLTDIARHKDAERTDYLISNWLRNRNTIEFLGIWEVLNNPAFNPIEFDGIRKNAGLNSFVLTVKQWVDGTGAVALFGKTAKQWREAQPEADGNLRDQATLEQLVVLSNLESLNSVLIRKSLPQAERLVTLNQIAITQMRSLFASSSMKRLK